MTKRIEIDGNKWRHVGDAIIGLRVALGAIPSHGNSIDAFIDSMVYGGMLEVDPPYLIIVSNVQSPDAAKFIKELSQELVEARAWRKEHYGDDVDVSVSLVD